MKESSLPLPPIILFSREFPKIVEKQFHKINSSLMMVINEKFKLEDLFREIKVQIVFEI